MIEIPEDLDDFLVKINPFRMPVGEVIGGSEDAAFVMGV